MAYILLVDDDKDFTLIVEKVLTTAGHEVAVLLDATLAVASMEARRPDLAILDVMFPENSTAGFDLARAIQANEELKEVPLLMLTAVNEKFPFAFGSKDIDEEWMPVADFIEKPVDLDVLNTEVARLLGAAPESEA